MGEDKNFGWKKNAGNSDLLWKGEKLIPLKKRKFGIGEQRNVPP